VSVVEPVALSNEKNDEVVVANVVGEDVLMYSMLFIARKLNGDAVEEPSVSVSCGRVEEASVSAHFGVVVPNPTAPTAVSNALFVTAPKVDAPERYWSSVPVPPGLPPPPPPTHVPFTAKQPVAILMPFPKLEVAVPVTSSFMSVVLPVLLLRERMDDVVVANVVGEDVEKYRLLLMARRLNGEEVSEPSESVSCGAVEEASWSRNRGVDVPTPP
jgi:hypothetical protein